MINLSCPIPSDCVVAVSGGADSIALLHFVTRSPKRRIRAAIFDHGTPTHKIGLPIVRSHCERLQIELIQGAITEPFKKGQSKEEYWRNERYKFLKSLNSPVLTGHNLNDNVETYIFGMLNGSVKFIPNIRDYIYRPFLNFKHTQLVEYCERYNLQYFDDPCNYDESYSRVIIRNKIVPECLRVNLGLEKVVRRLANEHYNKK